MDLAISQPFHIYNQGNNRVPIFYEDENYLFFLQKMRNHLFPYCHIMAYALMPNHFHWLVFVDDGMIKVQHQTAEKTLIILKKNIATLLSSYTQAVNNKYHRTGSLFRHRTKAIGIDSLRYARTCLHYIHRNPLKAQLVSGLGEWPYSSFADYAGTKNGKLVSKQFTFDYLNLSADSFLKESEDSLNPDIVHELF